MKNEYVPAPLAEFYKIERNYNQTSLKLQEIRNLIADSNPSFL